mgnify:CR=1 FL=1
MAISGAVANIIPGSKAGGGAGAPARRIHCSRSPWNLQMDVSGEQRRVAAHIMSALWGGCWGFVAWCDTRGRLLPLA